MQTCPVCHEWRANLHLPSMTSELQRWPGGAAGHKITESVDSWDRGFTTLLLCPKMNNPSTRGDETIWTMRTSEENIPFPLLAIPTQAGHSVFLQDRQRKLSHMIGCDWLVSCTTMRAALRVFVKGRRFFWAAGERTPRKQDRQKDRSGRPHLLAELFEKYICWSVIRD